MYWSLLPYFRRSYNFHLSRKSLWRKYLKKILGMELANRWSLSPQITVKWTLFLHHLLLFVWILWIKYWWSINISKAKGRHQNRKWRKCLKKILWIELANRWSDNREVNIAFGSFVIFCLNTLNKVSVINNHIKGLVLSFGTPSGS